MKTIIGFAQIEPVFGDIDANHKQIEEMANNAPNADLLIFPELATSGYDFPDKHTLADTAETFRSGDTSELVRELAKKNNCTYIIGYPELDRDKFFNSAFLVRPDGFFENYRKLHLFSRETELFSRGDKEPTVVETPAGRVGMMICFDWIFPETARLIALKGAQILAHPSNLVLQFCQRSMFARSVENSIFTVTANRIGSEELAGRKLTFTGASQVLDTKGTLLINAPDDSPHLGLAEIDPNLADDKQLNEHNNLHGDRRIELYGDLTKHQ